jgi:hypothetical protein
MSASSTSRPRVGAERSARRQRQRRAEPGLGLRIDQHAPALGEATPSGPVTIVPGPARGLDRIERPAPERLAAHSASSLPPPKRGPPRREHRDARLAMRMQRLVGADDLGQHRQRQHAGLAAVRDRADRAADAGELVGRAPSRRAARAACAAPRTRLARRCRTPASPAPIRGSPAPIRGRGTAARRGPGIGRKAGGRRPSDSASLPCARVRTPRRAASATSASSSGPRRTAAAQRGNVAALGSSGVGNAAPPPRARRAARPRRGTARGRARDRSARRARCRTAGGSRSARSRRRSA